MKCTVKIILNEVSCPGTLHLHDRNPAYISIFLFGRLHRSQSIYPSFPMVFNCKFKFRRTFTNAKTPEQVLEILEDEIALIQLKQEKKRVHGDIIIASFEEVARKFLFPLETKCPKVNHLKRDILLVKTDYLNNGKGGLNPQLLFKTKTIIEEAPGYILYTSKLPIVTFRDESYLSPTKASVVKKKRKSKAARTSDIIISEPGYPGVVSVTSLVGHQSNIHDKHCICECPELNNIDVEDWLELYVQKILDVKADKPFKAGKDPLNLISKRDFNLTKVKNAGKKKKGICQLCLVPSQQCVLCTAYKTVYGKDQFLQHRLKRKYEFTSEKYTTKDSTHSQKVTNSIISTTKNSPNSTFGSPNAIFHNIPMSTPAEKGILNSVTNARRRHSFFETPYQLAKSEDALLQSTIPESELRQTSYYSDNSNSSLDDDDIYLEEHHKRTPLPPETEVYDPWINRNRSLSTVIASPKESFVKESERIHARIKELMKKNNSVLQHELSSDSSPSQASSFKSDDEVDLHYAKQSLSRFSFGEPPLSTSSQRSLPAKSVTVPIGRNQNWLLLGEDLSGRNRRDIFDTSLKHKYKKLYEKSLNHP